MEERPQQRSVLGRYWPVLVVGVVVAAVVLVGALRGGDDGDDGGEVAADTTAPDTDEGEGEGEDEGEGASAEDAPDCDPETGRIMIPSVYAPNCVPLWDDAADNGGATHAGVTADEIVVVVYGGEPDENALQARSALGLDPPSDEEHAENRQKVVDTYNALFETYGRTVHVEVLETDAAGNDEVAARANAIRAADEMGAFAVVGGPANTPVFAEELANRGVLCLCTASLPIERYLEWAPHVWGGLMSSTQGYVHRADFILSQLAGEPAEFAGDEAFHTQERTFGLVWYDTPDNAYADGVAYFEELLAAEGVELELDIRYEYGTGANLDEDAQSIIAQMKEAGVTSVIFAGDPFMPTSLTNQATAQDYWPEWILTGSTGTDVSALARSYDQEQWRHAFGISFTLPIMDPRLEQQEGNVVSWHLGEELSTYPEITSWDLLFRGIHLAGPELTPETFRDGLFSFEPVSGHATRYGVSYGTELWEWEDYTSADDVKIIWYDPDTADPREENEEVLGVYRCIDGCRRYLPGELGDIGPLFEEDGSIVWFTERPEGDRSPQYPPRTGREDAS
ncbi:ABC transporter substrate-binding protein [Actinomarinicola tropica]|uniref:ABC transporter substrate-binding protein n=1 Tax=Actinomarinicola tropica TaxID=2789776 RepID=A0A5Q2RLS2_9ACTN|nr:ABC transporter substrate-binding protein [Actinomarinicola tropica]QGG95376.1 ABC transporter substrate-binding protein [Actinomarinicola tropica]